MCLDFVKHFQETDSKFVVSRLVLHTKITDSHDLVLLYCSSARVLPSAAAMPLPLPSGTALHVLPDPSTTGSGGVSQLQKKFRVSLEIATQYLVKPVEDQRHNAAGGQASKRRGTVKGPSNDELGVALAEGRRSFSRPGSSNGGGSAKSGDHGRSSPVSTPPDTNPNVTVGGRSAAHHGFLLRSNTPSSPPRSGSGNVSLSSSPVGKGLGGERGRMMSFRASSSAERLSLIGIVQDVLRSEERKEGVTDQQRTKAKHLLQAALKKVGATSMRTALLQTRPNEELTEFEKMELLFLKMQELERRRMRRGSSGNLLSEASPPPTFHQRGGGNGGQHASFDEESYSSAAVSKVAHAATQRNVVMDGVLARDIDASVEDRWMEIAYAAQTHFDTRAFGGKDVSYTVSLDGRRGGADAAILRWLETRKAVTESIGEIRRGVSQLEGATFRFDLDREGTSPAESPTSISTELVTLTVPQQVRAAQKLFHEAHEAMSSKVFVQFVRDAMKQHRRNDDLLHTKPLSVSEQSHDTTGREVEQLASAGVSPPLEPLAHDDDEDDGGVAETSMSSPNNNSDRHPEGLGESAQYSDEFDEGSAQEEG
ncbi:Hypothetical protein, putative [Bodo saltans]|uniref:Uncharacterized protein n=1 Tax=Bodo saltans TaxID=75058 RepID=A0A0S4KHW7_BODSA|nr:Hypothetical protein, putative [Bodo saltans]|eukprot:CUI14554.1 Hypothetical protein, putative [Bodo saltans]